MSELNELVPEREQQDSITDIEDRVERCDSYDACCLIEEGEVEECVERIEYDEPEHRTDDLNRYVNSSNSLSVSVNSDGGQNCSSACTDVGTHDNRYSHTVCDASCK